MRIGLLGSTAMAVSFWGAPAVSWFTVTSGARTLVPSSGLDKIWKGVTGIEEGLEIRSLRSDSCSINAEKRICKPAVPFTDATLPARVVMS